MSMFGRPPAPPAPAAATPAPELSEEEKQAAERKKWFDQDLKKAQDELKTDRRDEFVRSR